MNTNITDKTSSESSSVVCGTTITTTPYDDQRAGTSGLRRRVAVFQDCKYYLHNFVQCILDEIPICNAIERASRCLIVSGDGRYFNNEAAQIIIKMMVANGFQHVVVGTNFLMSTPAISAVIRQRKALGGIILTASHNPGGEQGDFGIKFNVPNGGAAPENVTDAIYERSKRLQQFRIAEQLPDIDVSKPGTHVIQNLTVEVIDGTVDHINLLRSFFDFNAIKKFLHADKGFSVLYDAMHGVAGPTARAVLVDELGLDETCLMNAVPSPNFNGGHPDPNLTYAKELVQRLGVVDSIDDDDDDDTLHDALPDIGCAGDGDMDRNMILGKQFFVTPSDSLAVIAANASLCIPGVQQHGLAGLARSMPTSGAVDRVADKLGVKCFEVPTGWKFFCNLMDSNLISICGEESFGTGSSHIREKDGMWALLAWLSIMEFKNRDSTKMTVADVVREHWRTFGRNFYTRYDYEDIDVAVANEFFSNLISLTQTNVADIDVSSSDTDGASFSLERMDEFSYTDPVDQSVISNQGFRFLFSDNSRIIFRRSGTGSVGATIRVYIERFEQRLEHLNDRVEIALRPIVDIALRLSRIAEITGRDEPTVIT